jgi:hypothetical protein
MPTNRGQKKMKKGIALALLALAIGGCATKNYGRQGTVSTFEQDTMTCREIDLEIARTQGFLEHVNKESEFSGRDVLAFLGDFGIGNSLEKTAALESATKRTEQLKDLRTKRSCAIKTADAAK